MGNQNSLAAILNDLVAGRRRKTPRFHALISIIKLISILDRTSLAPSTSARPDQEENGLTLS